jgi:glycosyltransferase involved in cell wall biosynthesis
MVAIKQVTIGIPIYKRLENLPSVLRIVGAQDYPNIDVLVSDNGMNGESVREIVKANYPSARFRQNATTVSMSKHFNQLIDDAAGEYFLILADDDEISSNYVTELVAVLDHRPQASVAVGVQETIDDSGVVIRSSSTELPEILSGPDFIRAAWGTQEFRFESFSTFLARTAQLRACGGFPEFWKGAGHDDALVIRLCLDNFVVFSSRCAFKKRLDYASYGYGQTTQDLAKGVRDLLMFLETDPTISKFAELHTSTWSKCRRLLIEMAWKTYYDRWADMYKQRLSPLQWTKAAFELPWIPHYYRAVTRTFFETLRAAARSGIRQLGFR